MLAALTVDSDVGPLVGCGLIFPGEREARSFARAAQAYYEAASGIEKAFVFEIDDEPLGCVGQVGIIVGDDFSYYDIEAVGNGVSARLVGALADQPFIFVILCRNGQEGLAPILLDEIIIYRGMLRVNGDMKSGRVGGRWPSTGRIAYESVQMAD